MTIEQQISKEQLELLRRSNSIRVIANEFGVDDATIHRLCRKYGLPKKYVQVEKRELRERDKLRIERIKNLLSRYTPKEVSKIIGITDKSLYRIIRKWGIKYDGQRKKSVQELEINK